MPHDSLIDATQKSDPQANLLLARFYLHRGKHRLQKGFSVAGIAALYDSLLFGMRFYVATHKHCGSFVKNADPWDPSSLFYALVCAGIFDDPLAFNRFSLIVERALWQASFLVDADSTLAEVERMLTKLGVIPFDESALPSESLLMINNRMNENIVY